MDVTFRKASPGIRYRYSSINDIALEISEHYTLEVYRVDDETFVKLVHTRYPDQPPEAAERTTECLTSILHRQPS